MSSTPTLDTYEARLPETSDWVWSTFREHEEQLDREAAQKFADLHGENGDGTVFLCKNNSDLLLNWLKERNARVSLKNLEIAARELADELEPRPEPDPEPTAPVERGIKRMGEVTFLRDAISAAHRERYADKPYESDVARKKRDEQLRRDAIAERYARRPESNQAMPIGTARAEVAKARPELVINSPEYNAIVAKYVRGEVG